MVNVYRGLVYLCLQFTEGCSQRHSRVHPSHLNAVFLFFFFFSFPNRVNVTHESIRDFTMFGMLIFEKKIY